MQGLHLVVMCMRLKGHQYLIYFEPGVEIRVSRFIIYLSIRYKVQADPLRIIPLLHRCYKMFTYVLEFLVIFDPVKNFPQLCIDMACPLRLLL